MVTSQPPRRVLVTGVGAAPGLDLARSLQNRGCEVIAVDADPLAPGLHLRGVTARTMSGADHAAYTSDLLGLCRDLRPDAVIPTVEDELPRLLTIRSAVERLGVRMWLPTPEAVEACSDKAVFAAVLQTHSIPTPVTALPPDLTRIPEGTPLVVKPRRGHGAQGVYFCSTHEQARALCDLVENPFIQQRVRGREFTADCLVDPTGHASVILRYRLLVKGGLAVVSQTFHHSEVAAVVAATLAAVGIEGLCCAQGFLLDDGGVVMTEVNARIAGGFAVSEAAGADLVGQALNGLFDAPIDHTRLTYQAGVRVTKGNATLAIHTTA